MKKDKVLIHLESGRLINVYSNSRHIEAELIDIDSQSEEPVLQKTLVVEDWTGADSVYQKAENLRLSESTKKVDRLYLKYKDKFKNEESNSLSNLLWQLIVNKTYKEPVCLYDVWRVEGLMLVIVRVDQDGSLPPDVLFKEHISDDEAWEIVSDINKEAFGLDREQWDQIVSRSMGMA